MARLPSMMTESGISVPVLLSSLLRLASSTLAAKNHFISASVADPDPHLLVASGSGIFLGADPDPWLQIGHFINCFSAE
jgi:hypothetical protein